MTIRRGGTLTDPDHHLLALWAASCAEHVLGCFESARPDDPRPGQAIEHARAWVRGEVNMTQARAAAGRWQREQLPEPIRELVLDDQRLRNSICWSVFDC